MGAVRFERRLRVAHKGELEPMAAVPPSLVGIARPVFEIWGHKTQVGKKLKPHSVLVFAPLAALPTGEVLPTLVWLDIRVWIEAQVRTLPMSEGESLRLRQLRTQPLFRVCPSQFLRGYMKVLYFCALRTGSTPWSFLSGQVPDKTIRRVVREVFAVQTRRPRWTTWSAFREECVKWRLQRFTAQEQDLAREYAPF